jgi:hypothetical protein
MRFSFFALFLLAATAALGQTAPPANLLPQAQPGRQLQLSVAPQQFRFLSAPTMQAQNAPSPLTLYATPANAKPQQIPTQWPNAKFEPIPTQWPNARVVLIGGATEKAAPKAGPETGLTVNLVTAPRK